MRRRVAIGIFLLLLPIALHALWDYIESRRFFTMIDEMRQRGEPVSRNALGKWERPTGNEETRAARYYNAAGELAFRDWVGQRPSDDDPDAEARRRANADLEAVFREGALSADVGARLRHLRESYHEALEMADKAAPLQFSRFPPQVFDDYPRTYSLEALATACSARTITLAFETEGEQAGQSLWSCVRLRRAHVRSVSPIRWLLVELRFVLERTRPSADLLTNLQDAFAQMERSDLVERDIRERTVLGIEDALTRLYGAETDPLIPAAHVVWSWRPSLPERPWIVRGMTAALQRQQQALEAAKQPWPAKISAVEALAKALPTPPMDGKPRRTDLRFYAMYLPQVIDLTSAGGVIAHLRSATVAVAVERFRRDHGGLLPANATELVPRYLAEWPHDPFSGEPLKFVSGKGRVAVYSVGRNGIDDGGAVEPLMGMTGQNSKDVGLAIQFMGVSQ